MSNNIFDLENLDDAPPNLKLFILRRKRRSALSAQHILPLFEIKKNLLYQKLRSEFLENMVKT